MYKRQSWHSANEHVAAHSRFLFTNVKLELEPVGASKKRKAAEMRSSDSTDLATPALGNRRLEGRVPDAVHDAVHDAVNDVFGYPIGVVDGVADPFAAEFLHLDGRRDDGKVKPMGVLDDFAQLHVFAGIVRKILPAVVVVTIT